MTALTSLTDLSIREAGDHFRTGRLSPVELAAATLDRIAATEPTIHAYVLVTADEALAQARRAEAELRAGHDRGPLHGIPVAIKDIFDVAGLPTRCGSRSRDEALPAAKDASSVARLRAAGAVLVGKTVTQEFAAGVVSAPARNPWAPARVPGGSSGGSAAAVAAGACVAALGSDTGGSIRIPASVTGIVGLKPTYGLVGTRGVFPLSWSLDTVGPLARTVEDAALVLNALAGADPLAPATVARPAGDFTSALNGGLRGLRLGVPPTHFFERIRPDVGDAVEAALRLFAEHGAEVVDAPWPEAGAARAVAFLVNRIEWVAVHEALVREQPERLALLNPDLRVGLEAGGLIPAAVYLRALRARQVVKRSMARLFGDHRLDALLVPTLPATAALAERLAIVHDDGEEPLGTGYTRLTMPFNATGQPALAIPCGFDRTGLPIGMQIVGRPFAEMTVCRIGYAYERASAWHRRRPPL